ncbi:MAG: DEAD/DEAH box helicase family protein [Planctomycetes bacterium]|nr:DEAD/DEAH box helicase family protein [Planctomycetota bacterium]
MPINEADTCRKYVLPKLVAAGWTDERIREQAYFTDGRVVPAGHKHVRKPGKLADYVLLHTPDFPLAVVEAKSADKTPGDGLQQAMEYAQILGVKFAYSTNGHEIIEHDFLTGKETVLTAFPAPVALWARQSGHLKLVDAGAALDLSAPFNREYRNVDGSIRRPRYFQQIAIDRAVQAVLEGKKRALLTLATGTGKTFVAAQIVWKLWKSGRKKRILYLADRTILLDQPRTREFSIFGDALWRIQGEAKTGREVYFATYQAIAEDESRPGLYREYPPDYFDLIVVDECHRGSARSDSSWRSILEYFGSATQIGMTATPRRRENADTYEYFGEPVYSYSLATGIDDGFLAPFRVQRVVPNVDATGWAPAPGQVDRYGSAIPGGLYTTPDYERFLVLVERTEAIARHLTEHLKRTDRFAKTIVFCVDQEHSERMRRALSNANSDLVQAHPNYVVRIVSDEGDVGRGHLEDFQDLDARTPTIVTTSQLLSTGVDIPTCKNIVLVKPIGSMVEFKQIIGRGTRLCEERDKLWFTILDYAGATRLFADPEFDGEPEAVVEVEIDAEGNPIPRSARPDEVADAAEPDSPGPAELGDGSEMPRRKLVVDGVQVHIAAEFVYELDPSGGRLRTVRYTEYTAEKVRALCPTVGALRSAWSTAAGRETLLRDLLERGVTIEDLARASGQPDADPLDLLVHVAWQTPLRTRRERADRVRRDAHDFFDRFPERARLVLGDLLDKYAEHGPTQLDDLHILEVPPISERGSVVEIAQSFGGADRMREAVAELHARIYVA